MRILKQNEDKYSRQTLCEYLGVRINGDMIDHVKFHTDINTVCIVLKSGAILVASTDGKTFIYKGKE